MQLRLDTSEKGKLRVCPLSVSVCFDSEVLEAQAFLPVRF
jgi:hypothetical protein